VRVDKGTETGVRFGVWYLPRETTENHAHEDNGDTPHIGLARVIVGLRNDFWS
jgi:hypothetical protein